MERSAVLDAIPPWFWDIPYVGAHYPGGVPREALRTGGNCQLFAYEVLAVHGFSVANLRSDDLWHDTASTVQASVPQPLDLVLFQKDGNPYGAHVGLVVAYDEVLHLCKEVGRPAIWRWSAFAERPRFAVVIGYKRPIVAMV